MLVWYPTTAAARERRFGAYTMAVAEDAAVAPARHGLIVLSHGTGGDPMNLRMLALTLARAGYIAVAPQHARDNYQDGSGIGSMDVWAGRPRQVTLAIDWVVQHPRLGPHLDTSRIGVLGHSAGGYTALAVVGAIPDPSLMPRHCREHPEDTGFCRFGGDRARNNNVGLGPISGTRDTRVRAAVLLAPLGVPFTDKALYQVTVPVRLYAAELDTLLVRQFHADRIRNGLGRAPEFVLVPAAGHYSFVAPFPFWMKPFVGEVADDPPGFDRARFLEQLAPEVVDFFDRVLRRV